MGRSEVRRGTLKYFLSFDELLVGEQLADEAVDQSAGCGSVTRGKQWMSLFGNRPCIRSTQRNLSLEWVPLSHRRRALPWRIRQQRRKKPTSGRES